MQSTGCWYSSGWLTLSRCQASKQVILLISDCLMGILQAFDELLLLERGGRTIYAGLLGEHSNMMVSYFHSIPGVPALGEGNPATWCVHPASSSTLLYGPPLCRLQAACSQPAAAAVVWLCAHSE